MEAKQRKRGSNGVILLLSLAAIGLAVALVMIMLKKQQQADTTPVATTQPTPPTTPANQDEAIRAFLELAQKRRLDAPLRSGLARTKVAVIGPVVAAELESLGIRVDAMPEDSYSMKPLVTSVCELVGGGR